MGDPQAVANGTNTAANVTQISLEYTSTRSIFIMHVGTAVQMNITFLSPITPDDFMRQSIPFTYLNVAIASLDGAEHAVQLYSDISGGEFKLPSSLLP